ncbi:MAG: hypothetical protein AB7K37_13740 [Cyclobacteriaceae bacterium]
MTSDIKLKLKSKKLNSGRFQVNFFTEGLKQEYYGYLLTEPRTSVREIMEKIGRHVEAAQLKDRYFQRNLFSLQKREVNSGRILVFKV